MTYGSHNSNNSPTHHNKAKSMTRVTYNDDDNAMTATSSGSTATMDINGSNQGMAKRRRTRRHNASYRREGEGKVFKI